MYERAVRSIYAVEGKHVDVSMGVWGECGVCWTRWGVGLATIVCKSRAHIQVNRCIVHSSYEFDLVSSNQREVMIGSNLTTMVDVGIVYFVLAFTFTGLEI